MSTTDIRTVAVIGLGNMGGPMAANLAKAGLTVHGPTRRPRRARRRPTRASPSTNPPSTPSPPPTRW